MTTPVEYWNWKLAHIYVFSLTFIGSSTLALILTIFHPSAMHNVRIEFSALFLTQFAWSAVDNVLIPRPVVTHTVVSHARQDLDSASISQFDT